MLKLLSKEFRLFLIKPTLIFLLLSATMLIPGYPAIVSTFFSFFILQICFITAQSNRDIEFTALLPVSRNQIVASKILATTLIQLTYLLLCVPFAIISSTVLNATGNSVGMDKNIAFFGYALVATAIFDILFFSLYFKNTHKIGLPMVASLGSYFVFSVLFEFVVAFVPSINRVLDTLNSEMLMTHLLFFACCLILYLGIMFGTYKLSSKAFKNMVI